MAGTVHMGRNPIAVTAKATQAMGLLALAILPTLAHARPERPPLSLLLLLVNSDTSRQLSAEDDTIPLVPRCDGEPQGDLMCICHDIDFTLRM